MSDINPIVVIIIATIIFSYRGFQDSSFFERYSGNPFRIKHYKEYYRLLTHMLLHADLIHIAFNMFILHSFSGGLNIFFQYTVGPLAPAVMVVFYITGGLCGMWPLMKKYANNPNYTCVGASGAVSAITVGYMIAFPNTEILFFFIPMPAYIAVVLFFVTERLMQKYSRAAVAHEAHIAGAVFGAVCILLMRFATGAV